MQLALREVHRLIEINDASVLARGNRHLDRGQRVAGKQPRSETHAGDLRLIAGGNVEAVANDEAEVDGPGVSVAVDGPVVVDVAACQRIATSFAARVSIAEFRRRQRFNG